MDLRAIVEHYKQNRRPCAQAQLDSFRNEPTLEAAVRRAALARRRDGKRYKHQRRPFKAGDLPRAEKTLSKLTSTIARVTSFAALHDIVKGAVGGWQRFGSLYIYDTALRIGAKQGIPPEHVYLHSGTRQGARNLAIRLHADVDHGTGAFDLGIDVKRREILDPSELPAPFHELKPYEIEDVLCIYKRHFSDEIRDLDDIDCCCEDEDGTGGSSTN
jgi:hypothetical protein